MNNIFYVKDISAIGGVETYLYEIAKKYCDTHDIAILYKTADNRQLQRLKEYVPCIKFENQKLECDTLITNYDTTICDYVKAKHYYGIVHADYILGGWTPALNGKIEKYFGVSETACKSFTKLTNIPCELLINPLTIEPKKKMLRLVSATRINKAKGSQRMNILARELRKQGISFEWLCFGEGADKLDKDILVLPSRLDVRKYISNADFVVQLSDSEACSYTIAEALAYGVPVIVSEHTSFKEQGVKDGINGYIIDYEMKHIPKIKPLKFTPILRNDGYDKIMAKGEGKYHQGLKMVVATDVWEKYSILDSETETLHKEGETFLMSAERRKNLDRFCEDNNYPPLYKILF